MYNETQKYGLILRSMSANQLEKLQSNLLKEMRRRDSEQVKNDVLANSKALRLLRLSGKLTE